MFICRRDENKIINMAKIFPNNNVDSEVWTGEYCADDKQIISKKKNL